MVKSGGSQLSQLKSALSQSGLSRQSQAKPNSKKRKRAGASSDLIAHDKDRRNAKLQQIQEKLNPFEVKTTKLKHDIPGLKVKGVSGKPAVSRQAGLDQRRKTLLVEYDQRGRAGGILDRRFGEDDLNMTPEERMLERFTKERQRASRVSFNLEDDEDELTHYGQSLSAVDDFDGTGLALEDEDEANPGQIDHDTMQADHFGGFENEEDEDQPARKKSKAEVMAEVITKSKEHRHARQVQKEENDDIRHQLDQDFADIRQLLFNTPPDPSATGSNNIPLGIPRTPKLAEDKKQTSDDVPLAKKDEEYDQFVRELIYEKRAQPTDRLKTEEEIAAEEKEKLEKAERARIRRMEGEDSDSSEDDARGRGRKKRRRKPEADDLEDDFEPEDDDTNHGLGSGLGGIPHDSVLNGDEASEDDDEDEEEASNESSSDGSEDEGSSQDVQDDFSDSVEESGPDEGEPEDLVSLSAPKDRPSKYKYKRKDAKAELPFTFPCPETHGDFLDILENVDSDDVATVVHRIRVLYHPSLAEDNKRKLGVFTTVLIDHILYAASPPTPLFNIISSIYPHLYVLTKSYPVDAANAFISKLTLMQKNLSRGLARGATSPDAKTFPGTAELAFLRIIGAVWSTSDRSHPVVAPAMLLMGQYLAQCRVRSVTDIASGLFICTIFLQYQELSKRIVPEAINFLYNTLVFLVPHTFTTAEALPGCFPAPDFDSEACQSIGIRPTSLSKLEPEPPNLLGLLAEGVGATSKNDQPKVDLLGVTLTLLGKYSQLFRAVDGFVELFEPGLDILDRIKTKSFSAGLLKRYNDVQESLTKMLKFARQGRRPLALQIHKPIAIPSIAPKFDMGYSARKGRDLDPEQNADQKLKALYKKEKKGALRELRKDNRFLAVEKAKREDEKDSAYKAKLARAVGEMHSERHEQKVAERIKAQEKKRAGRK